MSKGFIYILINPSFPYLLKIGRTINIDDRIKQLSRNTSTPSEFQLVFSEEVDNCEDIERSIHDKLFLYRNNVNREFFRCNIKLAIEVIFQVIKDYNNQIQIDFQDKKIDKFIWWNSLDQFWKQTLKSQIELNFKPDDIELIETIGTIIYDVKDLELRKKVIELVKHKNFRNKIRTWYEKLFKSEKNMFKSYINNSFTEENIEDLDKILNLTKIDCYNHILINDLSPLIMLEKLTEINCKDTSIKTLEPLRKLKNLEIIDINYTKISSLEPLEDLKNLVEIHCCYTNIKKEDIIKFNKKLPNCLIKDDFI